MPVTKKYNMRDISDGVSFTLESNIDIPDFLKPPKDFRQTYEIVLPFVVVLDVGDTLAIEDMKFKVIAIKQTLTEDGSIVARLTCELPVVENDTP